MSSPTEQVSRRRSERSRPAPRVRPAPAAGALILYSIGRSIPRSDRHDLQQLLDVFHANDRIQELCRVCTSNATTYLVHHYNKNRGHWYTASQLIPPGTYLCVYSGSLERGDVAHSRNHEMLIGKLEFTYPLYVDGTPGRGGEDTRPGQLQLVNHACQPNNNCDCEQVVCDETGITAFFLQSGSQPIPPDREIRFPYQEMKIVKGQKQYPQNAFWKEAATLRQPRGKTLRLVLCNCAGGEEGSCPNGYGRIEAVTTHQHPQPLDPTPQPAIPPPPPPLPPATPPPPTSPPSPPRHIDQRPPVLILGAITYLCIFTHGMT